MAGCTMLLIAITAGAKDGEADSSALAAREINALIAAVENSDCIFDRNGDRHDAPAAADHLRLKYRRGKRYADTPEHFIERLASKSSWSGKPYFIECDGSRVPSADWLTRELQALRENTP